MVENKMFCTLLKKEIREDERTITIWANRSDVVDRSGHVIDDDAWELDRFLSNPVVCAFHRYDRPPVAKALWARVVPGKGLMMKIKFASTDEGMEFYQLYSENILNAFSVGFSGKEYVEAEDMDSSELKKYIRNGVTPNTIFKRVELFEVSCVAVPDNYASLVEKSFDSKSKELIDFVDCIKKSKEYIELVSESENKEVQEKAKVIGYIDLENSAGLFGNYNKDNDKEAIVALGETSFVVDTKCNDCEKQGNESIEENVDNQEKSEELVEKIETTDEYHHIPVKDKSQFVDGSFKTIDITDGVKAIVGKLKSDPQGSTHVQKYLFDVDKFSLEEAKKWIQDHKKSMDDEKPCKQENGECKKECPEYDDCEDEMKKAMHEDKPKKPCKQEGGECKKDCEEYGTCEDEAKKSFEIEIKGVFIDGFGMVKFMKKFEELELKELLEIVYGDIKDFYHDNGSLKYLYYENLPENLKSLIKEYKTTAKGYMTDIVFREKSEAMEKLAGLLGIFKEDINEDAIEDKGISDDSEAELLDISDNGVGEIDRIVEEKEVNLDEVESELDDIIEDSIKELEDELIETKDNTCVQKTIDLFNSLNVKNFNESDKKFVNKQFESDFDITSVKTEPANFEYKIFCKFLGCKIKNIFPTQFFIPSPMKGNYLSAFKNLFSEFNLLDQRNFIGNGGEIPLRFSVVKLNSKLSEEFLTDGTQFYESEDKSKRFVTQVYPSWGGLVLDIYTTNDEQAIELNKSFVNNAISWVKENNFLKGEKFSISGDFIEKTGMDWDSVIFPSDNDKDTLMKNMDRLSKNSNGRGIMLIGPPGTGKTMTGKVLMEQKDITFIWASSKDFSWGVNGALTLGFDMARDLSPSILFLEDIDSWIRDYTVDLLKTEMDGIRSNKGVLTILTSNFPEDIPDALIDRPGRFHHIINFSLPNKENRIKLLKFFTENADKEVIEKFADMTEGYSGSHLRELVDFAKMISEDEGISINEALIRSFEQMKEQRQLIHNIKNEPKKKELIDVKIENKSGIDFEIHDLKTEEKTVIDFEIKKQSVDFDLTKEEAQEIIKNSIINVAKEMQSVEDLVDERIKRAKGIIF